MEAVKHSKIKSLVGSKKFEMFILSVIILNTICLGLETVKSITDEYGHILTLINLVFVCIYVIEATLKIIALRGSYFKEGWNVFDFIIVIVSIIAEGGVFSGIRILRILRVLRSLRVISSIKPLSKIVQTILASIPGIGWTGILMLLIYYIYAIIGIQVFGEEYPELFGNFSKAFVTLFSLATMEGWQETVYPFTEVYPVSWFYFLTFFIIAAFILMNIVIGIVIDSISTVAQAEAEEKARTSESADLYEEINRLRQQLDTFQKHLEKHEGGKK